MPYTNIKLWSDLSTPTGLMAAFSKEKLRQALRPANALRLSLVCDNIRTPDNLGAVMRVAAAAGARQVVLTRGCVEAWSPKVVRAAAGAHFQVGWVIKQKSLISVSSRPVFWIRNDFFRIRILPILLTHI